MQNTKKSIKRFGQRISKKINIEHVDNNAAVVDSELDMQVGSDAFLHSLYTLTPDDIELNETAKNVKKPKPDILKYAVLLICAGTICFCAYNLIQTVLGYVEARQNYQEIRNIFFDIEEEAVSTDLAKTQMTLPATPMQDLLSSHLRSGNEVLSATSVQAEYSKGISQLVQLGAQLDKLKALNPDTYGWIRVMCPLDERIDRISYVVMQSGDNDYYLKNDFYRNQNNSGAIYGDFRISRTVEDNLNTIIYGHNMGDQTMFGPLLYFGGNVDKFNAGTIEISTWDGIYVYEIFSIYETYADSRGYNYSFIQTDFSSESEYLAFLGELKSKSKFEKDVKLTSDSKIVTLATCTNNWRDTRFAVHGVLVDSKKK